MNKKRLLLFNITLVLVYLFTVVYIYITVLNSLLCYSDNIKIAIVLLLSCFGISLYITFGLVFVIKYETSIKIFLIIKSLTIPILILFLIAMNSSIILYKYLNLSFNYLLCINCIMYELSAISIVTHCFK
jgi:hypothetical protein